MGALFYAPPGVTDEAAFVQAGAAAGIGPLPGWISAGPRTLFGIAPGAEANVQVRVWDTRNFWHTGYSPILTLTTGGGGFPPSLPAVLWANGLQDIHFYCPEPSTLALATIAAIGMLMFRRSHRDDLTRS